MREMERSGATALHGSFTLGARSGVSNDMGSDLARVVYPDPPPMRGGFWNDMESYVVDALVRSGATALRGSFAQNPDSEREAGSGTTWGALRDGLRGRSGATALRGSITQTRHLKARSGVWNDMRSATWWKKRKQAELRSRAGRLPRSLISEREAESGTTWGALRCGHSGRGGAFSPVIPSSEREANLERHEETYMELRPYEGRLLGFTTSEREEGSRAT